MQSHHQQTTTLKKVVRSSSSSSSSIAASSSKRTSPSPFQHHLNHNNNNNSNNTMHFSDSARSNNNNNNNNDDDDDNDQQQDFEGRNNTQFSSSSSALPSVSSFRNEHRLIIQLVIGMIALMCQGSIYCFSLFAPTLKSPPFNFKESQVNMIASLSALASFFNMPAGLIYDYCGGPRPTLAIGGTILSVSWVMLAMFVFNPNLFLQETNSSVHQHNNFSDTPTTPTTTSTLPSSSLNIAPADELYYLPLVLFLFCSVMCSATFLELGIVVGNMEAWRYHHGWLIVELKTFIGIGSSVVSLLYASEFSSPHHNSNNNNNSPSNDNNIMIIENLRQTGNFCMFLGIFSAISTVLSSLFTSAPPVPKAMGISTQSTPSIPFWDVRVIGVNTLPTSFSSHLEQNQDDENDNSSSHHHHSYQYQHRQIKMKMAARARVRPMMRKGLWLLLFCFVIVTVSNAIELGVSGLPSQVYSLIGIICSLMPLLFLLLLRSFFSSSTSSSSSSSSVVSKRYAVPEKEDDNSFVHGSPQAQEVTTTTSHNSSSSTTTSHAAGVVKLPENLVPSSSPSTSASSSTVEALKQLGNDAFSNNRFHESVEHYTQALDALEHHTSNNNNISSNNDELKSILFSNRSASLLHLGEIDGAVRDANSCIRCRPEWFKGFYRRGAALLKLKKYREALADLEAASVKDPSNREVAKAVVSLKNEIKKRELQNNYIGENFSPEIVAASSPQSEQDEQEDEEEDVDQLAKTSYKHKLVYFLEDQVGRTRRLPLHDLDDDFESELSAEAQNRDTVLRNCCRRPVDVLAMWVMFFGLWGSTVMIYSNIYSIYYALQGDSYLFTSARNAIFVSIFGVGNAAGRALAGLSVPFLQSRGRPVWTLLKVSPMLNVIGLGLFFVSRGAGLAAPFLITGIATGFTWGSTVIFVKRVFVLVGSHYSLLYSAGGAGILCLCFGMFAFEYERNAELQNRQNTTATTDDVPSSTSANFTTSPDSSSHQHPQHHCIGFDCVQVSFIVAVCLNIASLCLGEWIRYRIDRGEFDSRLVRLSSLKKNKQNDVVEKEDDFVFVPENTASATASSTNVGDNERQRQQQHHSPEEIEEYEKQIRAAFSMRHEQGEFESFSPIASESGSFSSSSRTRRRDHHPPNLEIYNDEEMM